MIKISDLKKIASVISTHSGAETLIPATDSRTIMSENLFIAIEGEKYNPLNFLAQLSEKNSCKFVAYTKNSINDELIKKFKTRFEFIETKDSILFLQQFSRLYSETWQKLGKRNLIGISGSNGKTTTKEMLTWLLKSALLDKVTCTQKNNNNHIGVPLTIFQIKPETLCAIVELGSNHPGEMKVVCDSCSPNIGFTTNIGYTHMEFFPTLNDVYLEEGYLQYMKLDIFFKNGEDSFLKTISGPKVKQLPVFHVENNSVAFEMNGKKIVLANKNVTGKHNFTNLGSSFFIAASLYPEFIEQFTRSAQTFEPTPNRSQWITLKNIPCYLDAYNANPSSMKAAIEGFNQAIINKGLTQDKATVILGDMNELGEHTSALHNEVGSFLSQFNFKKVIFIGRYAQYYQKLFAGNSQSFPNVLDYKTHSFQSDLSDSTSFFIKGSRSLQLEKLIDIT